MTDWSEKEDQKKKKLDKETLNENFLKLSYDDDLNKDKIKYFFQNDNEIEVENIDKLIRQKIEKFEFKPEKNSEILEELFLHADLNYINADYNDSNLIMECCEKAEPEIINLILDEKFQKKKKKIIELDLFKVDKNNSNILHHLFNQPMENDIEINFEKIMNYYQNRDKKSKIKLDSLKNEDINGITPLSMLLKKGWYNTLVKYFQYFDYEPHIIASTKNNNIHCAIEGGNIKCLKLILNYCSSEELNQTNINNLTPLNYAKEKKYYYMTELIKQYMNNSTNEELKNILLLPKMDTDELINYFSEKDFREVQKYLSKYKISQVINNSNINTKNINLSYEWNSLLTKNLELLNKGLTPENILSKYIRNTKTTNNKFQNKTNVIQTLLEFNNFFDKHINELAIKDHLNEENYPIDIIIYNRIIYHYKIFDLENFLKYVNLYFTHIYPQQENNFLNKYINSELAGVSKYDKAKINFYKYITFINISFLLIDFFIREKNEQFSQIILDELEKIISELKNNQPQILIINNQNLEEKENNICDESTNDSFLDDDKLYFLNFEHKINTINYFNKNEILHPLNKTLDETIYYLHLKEIFYIIKFNSSKSESFRRINKLINNKFNPENKKQKEIYEKDEEEDEDEEGENEYNNLYNNIFDDLYTNNFRINTKNLNRVSQILKELKENMENYEINRDFRNKFKIIYYELQSYLNYLLGNINESIHNINNSKLVSKIIKSHEEKIFYYNNQGIINLKLKKYSLSKHFFKLGINLFKSVHSNLNTSNSIYNNDIVINKIEYLYKMTYNLGLACFYNENYFEAYEAFNKLKNVPDFKNNIFLWFRLGLSSLNIYLISLRKLKEKQRKYYQNLNKNKIDNDNEEETKEKKVEYFIYESSSSSDSFDELIEEYKKEYGIKDDNKDQNLFIDNNNNNLLKIFLEPNSIKSQEKRNNKDNNYSYHSKKNEFDDYLDTSILSFKKVLKIYKKYNYINELNENKKNNLKGIFNFYTKNIGETKEFKSMLNNQIINKKNSVPKSLIYSCYLNLLFAYNLKKKYSEMKLLINSIKQEKNLSKNFLRKIRYYELFSLINLNKKNQANELISEEINKYGNIDSDANNDFDCFNLDDFQIEKDFNHKIFLKIGQVFLQCKNGDWILGYDNLMNVIKNNYNKNEEISKYYYKLMIYILGNKNNSSQIIQLIKYRWNQIQNNMNKYLIKSSYGYYDLIKSIKE